MSQYSGNPADNESLLADSIKKYRAKLIDISKRNNLISFKHSEKSPQHIRIIDCLPEGIFTALSEGDSLTFQPLPEAQSRDATPLPPSFSKQNAGKSAYQAQTDFSALTEQNKLLIQNIGIPQGNTENGAINEAFSKNKPEPPKKLNNREIAEKYGIDPNYDLPEASGRTGEARGKLYLQTLLLPDEMEKKLSKLESYIRTDIEESGVNSLYAAFMFLEHYEAEQSNIALFSPLVLVPLELRKQKTPRGYEFTVSATGEEPEINDSLAEYLKQNFGLTMPEYEAESSADSYDSYIAAFAEILKEAKVPHSEKWKIRRFLTIGRFHFARITMYRDLEDKQWPENMPITASPILQSLLTQSENTGAGDNAADYDIDALEEQGKAPILVTPADASQHSAIADVMEGRNLAIKGPPGTGKSQTITNIIANALAQGKKVLFLAEKMAALNVVYERLNDAGLGLFCLELHSAKARKTDIIRSLRERLEFKPQADNAARLQEEQTEFNADVKAIRGYSDMLNLPFGQMHKTIYEFLWGLQLRREQLAPLLDRLNSCPVSYSETDMSEIQLTRRKIALADIAELDKKIRAQLRNGAHPWTFIKNFSLDRFEQDEMLRAVKIWQTDIEEFLRQGEAALFMLSLQNINFTALCRFLQNSASLIAYDLGPVNANILARIANSSMAEELLNFIAQIEEYHRLPARIRILADRQLTDENIAEYESAIARARALSVSERTLEQFNSETDRAARQLDRLTEGLNLLSYIAGTAGLAGFMDRLSFRRAELLLSLPQTCADLSAKARAYRQAPLSDSANAEALQRAFQAQQELRQQQEAAQAYFDIALLGDSAQLRAQAAMLEQANFFSFLSASYRQAKKTYYLAQKHKADFKAEEAAAKLRMLADIKDSIAAFAADGRLNQLCGAAFSGLDTDLQAMTEANQWAAQIRRIYPASDTETMRLRQWLLTADSDRLNILAELAQEPRYLALKSILTQFAAAVQADKNPQIEPVSYQDTLALQQKWLAELTQLKNRLAQFSRSAAGKGAEVTYAKIADELAYYKNIQKIAKSLEENNAAKAILAAEFHGAATNIAPLKPTADFITACLSVPEFKQAAENLFGDNFQEKWHILIAGLRGLSQAAPILEERAEQTDKLAEFDFSDLSAAPDWRQLPLINLRHIITAALDSGADLNIWLSYNQDMQNLSGAAAKTMALYQREYMDFATLPAAFEYIIYYAAVRKIYGEYSGLRLHAAQIDHARANIKQLDKQISQSQRQHLRAKLSQARPLSGNSRGSRAAWTEEALLYNEAQKQKRHIAIRDLMQRAGKSIAAIKPCFLMSPLTIAQYLKPGVLEFDLLIIDEASQMRPEEALGGIARAKQIVVVGDPQQLPPTDFFQRRSDDETDEFIPDEDIMQLALTAYRPPRILSRHYRSRHESLIAFSNYHFYDGKLFLFPSAAESGRQLGLQSVYVGGTYEASCNRKEAEEITNAALHFMKICPNLSLGIATMNVAQQGLIEEIMDIKFLANDYAEDYRLKWKDTLAPFFIKNLENVQGDERDAIFISTVYGRDKNGAVMQRFGPINGAGGHRRLNVLFTRAKQNMTIFTSLKAEDIKISETSSRGLKAFKGFLSYAATKRLDSGTDSHAATESDFETWVKEKLESIGCEAYPQVGVAGYRIDLGVKHASYPHGYLLGIECDGAAYHSSKSARERDSIRQQILEGLGWTIYRIWSSDWFADAQNEFAKLKAFIAELLKEKQAEQSAAGETERENEVEAQAEAGHTFDAASIFDLNHPNADIIKPKNINAPASSAVAADEEADRRANGSAALRPEEPQQQMKTDNAAANGREKAELYDIVDFDFIKNGKTGRRRGQIVPGESHLEDGKIGSVSPIGSALLGGYSAGEEIIIILPQGTASLIIRKIERPAL